MTKEQEPIEYLVIDDDSNIRAFLEVCIELEGETVDTAADGAEGIEKYVKRYDAGNPYPAVLTDLNMPRASGADVTREVKRLSPNTPVYVITGNEPTQEYKRLSDELGELGPDDVLKKPISMDQIKELTQKIRLQVYGTGN
jgi:CheY-like chemotaxis protein